LVKINYWRRKNNKEEYCGLYIKLFSFGDALKIAVIFNLMDSIAN